MANNTSLRYRWTDCTYDIVRAPPDLMDGNSMQTGPPRTCPRVRRGSAGM